MDFMVGAGAGSGCQCGIEGSSGLREVRGLREVLVESCGSRRVLTSRIKEARHFFQIIKKVFGPNWEPRGANASRRKLDQTEAPQHLSQRRR